MLSLSIMIVLMEEATKIAVVQVPLGPVPKLHCTFSNADMYQPSLEVSLFYEAESNTNTRVQHFIETLVNEVNVYGKLYFLKIFEAPKQMFMLYDDMLYETHYD